MTVKEKPLHSLKRMPFVYFVKGLPLVSLLMAAVRMVSDIKNILSGVLLSVVIGGVGCLGFFIGGNLRHFRYVACIHSHIVSKEN
ncbi:MAG: hypothetical protein RSB23_01275 [Alistipes sp.]